MLLIILQLKTLFQISRKSFSRMGRNLSHLNCIGYILILYLLLIYVASFLASFIMIGTCLMLAGYVKLKLPTQLYITILPLPKYSVPASHF